MRHKNKNIKFVTLNLFALTIVFAGLIISCKKTETVDANCGCPNSGAPIVNNSINNLNGNGFFIFNTYYTISNNNVTKDSCTNQTNQFVISSLYPGVFSGFLKHIDSVKVNGINYKGNTFFRFRDTSNQCFSTPRTCELYGDTSMTVFIVNINYVDYTPTPTYNDWISLPDSIKIGRDSILNIGSRSNMLETQIKLVYNLSYTGPDLYNTELKNTDTQCTIPTSILSGIPLGYRYLKINVRNWSTIKLKKQTFQFVVDNTYIKKIKIYN